MRPELPRAVSRWTRASPERTRYSPVTPMAIDIDQHLKELSSQIDRLRVLYEQHFLGMEKMPPVVARREADKVLQMLGAQSIGNTALRFRYQTLLRRWKTYTERWDKVVREIESGTYRPHLLAKERRDKDRTGPQSTQGAVPRPAAPGSPIPGMSEAELRDLHRRYVEACRAVGDGREVKYDALVASLSRQVPGLMEKNPERALGFDVAVRGGKVILRAVARRDAS